MIDTLSHHDPIGIIGVGEMGGPIARTLLRAGHAVHAYDLDAGRLAAAVAAGATGHESADDVVRASAVILTSLPSSEAFVHLAETSLLPHARKGQIFIDLGTVIPYETRRLADLFAARDATLLDVPVSGGPRGAERADLFVFAGGDKATFDRVRPLLETIGGSGKLTYCGPSGSGQVVKGVNQLMMGLGAAAYLEAIAFGVRAGVDIEIIADAIGATGHQRADFNAIAQRIAAGNGENVGVKFLELPYFLSEAQERGFALPLTEVLHAFCDQGERIVIDDHRLHPSFWHQLMSHKHDNARTTSSDEPEFGRSS